jgi:hypothetical protein
MGDISPGDVVFGDDGRQVRVIAVSEVFNDHPCYLVRFSDGSEVVADAGHRWQVVDLQRRNEARKELKRRAARDADGTVARKRGPVSDDLPAVPGIRHNLAAVRKTHQVARVVVKHLRNCNHAHLAAVVAKHHISRRNVAHCCPA